MPESQPVTELSTVRSDAELLSALQEIVEALDRRIPQVERAGEAQIAADAARLRACAVERMMLLRQRTTGTSS